MEWGVRCMELVVCMEWVLPHLWGQALLLHGVGAAAPVGTGAAAAWSGCCCTWGDRRAAVLEWVLPLWDRRCCAGVGAAAPGGQALLCWSGWCYTCLDRRCCCAGVGAAVHGVGAAMHGAWSVHGLGGAMHAVCAAVGAAVHGVGAAVHGVF